MVDQSKIDYWAERWEQGRTQFHVPKVNDLLVKWYDKWMPSTGPQVVFVPLCGKSLDMKWLYNKGHKVVGVEAVEMAVKTFFDEQKLPHTVQQIEGTDISLYQTSDERLRIFCGNLFSMGADILGHVDAVWDRGSMVALNPEDLTRYGELIRELTDSKHFSYLLEAFEYDTSRFSGPPHHVPRTAIEDALGGFCTVDLLESTSGDRNCEHLPPRMREQMVRWNLDYLTWNVYLMTPK